MGRWMMALVVTLFYGSGVFAGEVEMLNGDRISGEVVAETEDILTLKTEAMGEVTIQKGFIKKPEPVAVKDPAWTGTVSTGYSQSGGNTQKSQFNISATTVKKTDRDEWSAKYDASYSSADKRMDAKKFYANGRYARSFGKAKRWYHSFKIEGEQDRFANVDYRIVPSAGVGYWFADEDDFKVMAELALGYEYTKYRDGSKSGSEPLLIPHAYLEKMLTDKLKFSQDITLYPSLKDAGMYRLRSETVVTQPINDRLSWKVSFVDELNSDPQGSTKKNDYRFITGLEYGF